jgi:hypothetical protein
MAQLQLEPDIDRVVLARQVDQAYRQAVFNTVVSPLVSIVLAYVTRDAGPLHLRVLWSAQVWLMSMTLLMVSLHRRSRPATAATAARLARQARVLAFCQGLSWGIGMFMLNPSCRDPELTIMVFAVMAGSCTAMAGQAALPGLYFCGFLPNWTLVAIAAAHGPAPWPTMAALVLLLAVLQALHSRSLNRRLGQALRLVVVNERMAAELAAAHRESSTSNAQLTAANAALSLAIERQHELAIRDELTGAFNRRHMLTVAANELARAERGLACFTLLLIDLDHFK